MSKSIHNGGVNFFIQNDSSKLTLSNLANEFLNASYIRLVMFLFILFKFYFILFFIYKDCILPKYPIFQLLEKEMWKKYSRRKFWEKGK